jgi:hypothetical protein
LNQHSESRCKKSVQQPIVPSVLKAFAVPSLLLGGESRRDHEAIRQMMVDDIQPTNNIEWLWTLDLIELTWEILRYRCLKERVLLIYREAAIESILQRLDGAGISADASHTLQVETRRNASEWRDDPKAAAEIEARLARHGYDTIAINAEVFIQAREPFAMFNDLMHSAQNRRFVLLREMGTRREFTKRARRFSKAVIEGEFGKLSKLAL